MTNNQRLLLSVVSLAVLAASCGRELSAPDAKLAVDPQPQLALTDGASYTSQFVIRGARGTTFTDGVNTLTFPAGSVCDPGKSSYGPGECDKPCAALSSDLTITVKATVADGRVNIDFSPNIRFSPARPVTLVVKNDAIKTGGTAGRWAIFYNSGDGKLVDEAVTDPSVVTYVDRAEGVAWRRIKHFSGFNVTSGQVEDCTPYIDPGCVPIDGTSEERPR
jgi:hypothetical protein